MKEARAQAVDTATDRNPIDIVLGYITANAKNGLVRSSLREIESATGVHYSTISRILDRLASDNVIRILPRTTQREPTAIQLVSEIDGIDFSLLKKALSDLAEQFELVQGYVAQQAEQIAKLEEDVKKERSKQSLLQGEVFKVEQLPGDIVAIFVDRKADSTE
jgi:signal-transduction protein with cAMP-binding, CBS, and nucleotidyltransferase domain